MQSSVTDTCCACTMRTSQFSGSCLLTGPFWAHSHKHLHTSLNSPTQWNMTTITASPDVRNIRTQSHSSDSISHEEALARSTGSRLEAQAAGLETAKAGRLFLQSAWLLLQSFESQLPALKGCR